VLAAWGIGAPLVGQASLSVSPGQVALGDAVLLGVQLTSTARKTQRLAIDYAVHHVKANGSTSPKVFKGWALELAPGEVRQLQKRHSMKLITTRRYFAGRHGVDLLVNGQVMTQAGGQAFFELLA
jgi:hypothetical protein